jgi:hypothetical protein
VPTVSIPTVGTFASSDTNLTSSPNPAPPSSSSVSPDRLRNLAIGILRAHGHRNVAAALRRNARDATRVLPLLGSTSA